MTQFEPLRLGLVVALFVLLIGVTAASLNIHEGVEIIAVALGAIGLLIATIVRKASQRTPTRHRE